MKYAVGILIRAVADSGRPPTWELAVICLEADDEDAARTRAEEIAAARYECEYETATGDRLRCRFDSVESVRLLDPFPPEDGSELFSKFLKDEEVRSLREPMDE